MANVRFIVYFLLIIPLLSFAQTRIIWSNKVLKATEKFESQDNNADMALGMPTVYLGVINDKIDPFTEGYILNYENTPKKNLITFSFPRVVGAEQLVLGGVFNLGTIHSVKIVDLNKQEIEVYRMTKGSVSKFHNFNIFFEPISVVSVKIEFDHTKINKWNLLRGIGLSESTEPIHPYPNIYSEDEFFGKELIKFDHKNKDCIVFAPKISDDGNTLYFVEECPGQDDQDIWVARKDTLSKKWGKSEKAPFPLNNEGHNFVASIGDRERFLLLGNAYKADGSNGGDGVSISHKLSHNNSWNIPQTLTITGFYNRNAHANFYMASDEKALLLAIEDSSTRGGLDIYVSFKDSVTNTWSKPKNLGDQINSAWSEDFPCLLDDGKTLFFSSNGYVGFGRYDLYMSQRLDDTWQNWSEPQNLGPLVNSKADDYGFGISADGQHAYYNSINMENDTLNMTDIYKINLPRALFQEPKLNLKGKILSSKDAKGVDALISIQNKSGTIQSFFNSSGMGGQYKIQVPVLDKYYVSIENPDFEKKEMVLDMEYFTSSVGVDFNFELVPKETSSKPINLRNITFTKGTSELAPESIATLDSLVAELLSFPKSEIEVTGHTDPNLSAKNAEMLSNNRALSVGKYLIMKGIAENRIRYKRYEQEERSKSKGVLDSKKVSITFTGKKLDTDSSPQQIKNPN